MVTKGGTAAPATEPRPVLSGGLLARCAARAAEYDREDRFCREDLEERVDGGFRFTGRKGYGALSPVWTHLGLHGMDFSDSGSPRVVHAFLPRDTDGVRIEPTWDRALGVDLDEQHRWG